MEFEWDPAKDAANFRKHKVSFREAATVFGDDLSVTVTDPDHSVAENRYIIIGMSKKVRLLLVAHVVRRGRIRLISARPLTRKEQRDYENSNG